MSDPRTIMDEFVFNNKGRTAGQLSPGDAHDGVKPGIRLAEIELAFELVARHIANCGCLLEKIQKSFCEVGLFELSKDKGHRKSLCEKVEWLDF
jgi:hypothetical protein